MLARILFISFLFPNLFSFAGPTMCRGFYQNSKKLAPIVAAGKKFSKKFFRLLQANDFAGIERMVASGEVSANGYESVSGYKVPLFWHFLDNLDLLKVFIKYGADPFMKARVRNYGETLDDAFSYAQPTERAIVKQAFLKDNGSFEPSNKGVTQAAIQKAVNLMIERNLIELEKMLASRKVSANSIDGYGLLFWREAGDLEMLTLFAKYGADSYGRIGNPGGYEDNAWTRNEEGQERANLRAVFLN